MIARLLTLTIFISTGSIYAQQTPAAQYILNQQATSTPHHIALSYLTSHNSFTRNNGAQLVLETQTQSKIGQHYFYQQYFKGLPVYGAFLKINTNHQGDILNSFNTLVNVNELNEQPIIPQATHWMVSEDNLIAVTSNMEGSVLHLKQGDGTILFSRDFRLYFTDTTIKARVFNPDPLTTAGVTYGANGTYRHFNDSDYALLNDQRTWVTMPARFNNDTFYLQNQYAAIMDFAPPAHTPATSTTDTFDFTRKDGNFKEVMALYHIYAVQEFIQSLGHQAVKYQLKVDALSGLGDQSFFSIQPDTTLNFGIGGVPDAEDADVIVHEYTHAIVHSLNPQGILAIERRALEEGICDAMSCAYSKRQNPFRWKYVFNWDGQNEFWAGRDGTTTRTYKQKQGDIYSDSEIWSSAMNNLTERLGEQVSIDLLLSVIPQLTPSSTMAQAARLMYDADSILNGGLNRWVLAEEFNQRQFGDFPTGLGNIQLDENIAILNTAGFASGSGAATVKLLNTNAPLKVTITNVQGKLIFSEESSEEINIDPALFAPGAYFAQVSYGGRSGHLKLIRR